MGLKFTAPKNASKSLLSLVFLLLTGLTLALLGVYWIGISIFLTMQGLLLLGVFTAAVGLRAFSPELSDSYITSQKKTQ